mmetsp:Transcript_21523/g.64393  ORF Transcript_21523/g.64393 Transcript_21523/m.64393 type:complete len:246 (-) Transcript_21523:67-804(-)
MDGVHDLAHVLDGQRAREDDDGAARHLVRGAGDPQEPGLAQHRLQEVREGRHGDEHDAAPRGPLGALGRQLAAQQRRVEVVARRLLAPAPPLGEPADEEARGHGDLHHQGLEPGLGEEAVARAVVVVAVVVRVPRAVQVAVAPHLVLELGRDGRGRAAHDDQDAEHEGREHAAELVVLLVLEREAAADGLAGRRGLRVLGAGLLHHDLLHFCGVCGRRGLLGTGVSAARAAPETSGAAWVPLIPA